MVIKRHIIDAAIILVVTVLLFLTIEFVLRLIYPEKVIEARSAYRFDPETLVSLKPDIEKIFERQAINGGNIITWKTNSQGLRGPELQKNPDLRIMVYGDSNIQARFSDYKDTYPQKLKKYLSEQLKDTGIEVINAGLVGAGPDQSLLRFKRDAKKFKPDVVVFHIFSANDYGDLIKNRLFNLNPEGEVVLSGMPTKVDSEILNREGFKHFVSSLLIVKAVKKFIPKQKSPELSADDWVNELLKLNKEYYAVFKNNKPGKFSHFGDYYDLDVATSPGSESSMVKIKLMHGVLLKAYNFARKNNIKFLVQIQPSAVDLTKNILFSYEDLAKFPDYKPVNLTSFIADFCHSRDIPCINLYDVYRLNNPEELYFRGANNHWNDAGQDLAAKASSLYIMKLLEGN